jgi:RNA polymerase sigma factor (sigma-70 family)
MAEDAELLLSYVENRSESAFSELLHRHLNLVYSAALRRTGGDPHRAADATQRVFISLATHARSLSGHTSLAGWLYACTRNAVLAEARAEKRRQLREHAAYAMQNLESPPPDEIDWSRLRAVLDQSMDRLSGRDREAILLRFFENRSYREVGTKLLLTEDAARMRVDRSLERLRASLKRRGVASTAAVLAMALAGQTVVAAPAGLAESVASAVQAGVAIGGAGSSAALGFLKIMSTTKTSLGIASAVCIMAVGSSIYEARQAHQAEAALAFANDANIARLRDLQSKVTAAEKARIAADEALRASKAAGPITASGSAGRRNSAAPSLDDMRKDPAFAALWRKQQLRAIQQRYGYAFSAMKLSPEALAKLKGLLVARIQARLDATEVGQEAGLTGRELSAAVRQAEGAVNGEIQDLVGNDGSAQLQASQLASQYEPLIASSVGIDLGSAGMPLAPDQASALAQIFLDHEAKFGPGAGKQVPDPQTGLTPYFQSLADRIAPNVTVAQLQIVKDYFIELEQQSQFSRMQSASGTPGH